MDEQETASRPARHICQHSELLTSTVTNPNHWKNGPSLCPLSKYRLWDQIRKDRRHSVLEETIRWKICREMECMENHGMYVIDGKVWKCMESIFGNFWIILEIIWSIACNSQSQIEKWRPGNYGGHIIYNILDPLFHLLGQPSLALQRFSAPWSPKFWPRRRCIKTREFENWFMGLDEVEQTAWMAPDPGGWKLRVGGIFDHSWC